MLTERDVKIVAELDRTGGLTARQLALALGLTVAPPVTSRQATSTSGLGSEPAVSKRASNAVPMSTGERIAHRRLAELARLKFAKPARPYGNGSEAIWLPTKVGLRELLADGESAEPSIMAATYKHQYGLGEVYALLIRCNVYHLTEREIRRRHLAEGHHNYSLPTGQDSWHQPDGLIFPTAQHALNDKPIAIELERSRKGGTRLRRIMEGYRSHRVIDQVLYICPPETTTSTINVVSGKPARKGLAPKTSLEDVVSVAVFRDIHSWLPEFLRAHGSVTDLRLSEAELARVKAAMSRYF